MFIVANLLIAVAHVLDILLWVTMWIVLIRALLSWVNPDPYNPIVRFLYNVTEPLLARVRSVFPFFPGGIDISPILVFIGIVFLQRFLVQSLYDLANSLRMIG